MFRDIREDIAAARDRDPACPSSFTIFFTYSGLHAIWAHHLHHWLWVHGWRGLARWLSQLQRHLSGVEIHPGAQIGRRFFIDHGMGIVIGETTIIGEDCMLYQGPPLVARARRPASVTLRWVTVWWLALAPRCLAMSRWVTM